MIAAQRTLHAVKLRAVFTGAALALACRAAPPVSPTAAPVAQYEPSRDLGPLFHDVQMARVFPDSKTFADARPMFAPRVILEKYAAQQGDPQFSLQRFVYGNFALPPTPVINPLSDRRVSMERHISTLWPLLTRQPDVASVRSTLIPLRYPYVVPGGRFREVYYWDSYFTMLGLLRAGRADLVKDMLDNFAYLVRTTGHVPNGNRTYYLGRSQPPYFAAMIMLYAQATDVTQAVPYLDALEKEYAFWMEGAGQIAPGEAHRRVVRLENGAVLNRYWDDIPEPRPESYREDFTLADSVPEAQRPALYRELRAGAESGWDFSSRWMRNPRDLRTLEVTDLAPIDLNSLLYNTEKTLATLHRARAADGDAAAATSFDEAAARRKDALLAASWDPDSGFFYDVRWRTGERVTDRPTLAAASVLFFGLASAEQGKSVAARLERDFLWPGGFVTTLVQSGQQWDAPNGWPPLEWLAIQGVKRYGRGDLADTARVRWLALNRKTYHQTGRMMEKYDVVNPDREAGGGEYPTQDGFGWTNGVALALAAMRP